MGLRFNPPPNWPAPPPDFVPPPRWQPDPDWPPPPPGWQLWVPDDTASERPGGFPDGPRVPPRPPEFAAGQAEPGTSVTAPAWPGEFPAGSGGFHPGTGEFPDMPGDYPGGPPGPSGPTNGFAVASFVLGLIGVGILLSYIFGVVALRQIRDRGQRGRGLAIAGLALSGVWTLVLIGAVVMNGTTPPSKHPASAGSTPASASPGASHASPGSSSGPTKPQNTNVFSLQTGECFQNPPDNQTVLGITYVTATPCTTLHNAQVFVQFSVTGTSYPGAAALKSEADLGCHRRIPQTVIKSKITDTMTLRYLYPLPTAWAGGHRTVTCLIVDAKADLTSSLLRASAGH